MTPSAGTGARDRTTAVVLCTGLLALAVLLAGAWAGPARAAVRHTPTLDPTQSVIDGPSADIVGLTQMSVARDGTGAVAYLKQVGGVTHVFVSRLLNGSFGAPQQVDPGLAGPSSEPVIAADNGGLLLVAFVNAGQIYVAQADSAAVPAGPASVLYAGAANPSLAISPLGQAYLAFTALGPSQDDVRTAFWQSGQWSLGTAPLDANPADDAGDGAGRPRVAACGDGIGIVTWGEGGHVFARRVIGTTPSTVVDQADPPSLDGWGEVSASDPVIASVGYSTYAAVGFTEQITNGVRTQSRVVYNRLRGATFDGAQEDDGTSTGGVDGAAFPQAAVTEFGVGYLTSELTGSHQLFASSLGANSLSYGPTRIDTATNTAAPDAVPAAAGLYSTLIAWQQTPGVTGPAEIRLRYAPNGSDLGAEQIVSNAALGATDANAGLVAGGDQTGDAAVAWVQGTGAATRIVAAQLYQPPGRFAPGFASHYWASVYPTMSWPVPAESWGPISYTVSFDGQPLVETSLNSIRTPAPVGQGRHVFQVSATNQAGLTVTARAASVFVDTLHPTAALALGGQRVIGARQTVAVQARDKIAPGLSPATASGVATVVLSWGDGTRRRATRGFTATHAYRRHGRYTISLTVTDRAGNRTTSRRRVTIAATPTPRPDTCQRTPSGGGLVHPRHRSSRAACIRSATVIVHPTPRRKPRRSR